MHSLLVLILYSDLFFQNKGLSISNISFDTSALAMESLCNSNGHWAGDSRPRPWNIPTLTTEVNNHMMHKATGWGGSDKIYR